MVRRGSSLALLLFVALACGLAPTAAARDMSPSLNSALETVAALEQALQGAVRQGAAVERTATLEVELFGRAEEGPVLPRLARLKEFVVGGNPHGLALRLTAAELALFARVDSRPMAERLAHLETALTGTKAEGPLVARLGSTLKNLGLVSENLTTVEVPAGTPVKVRLTEGVTSESVAGKDPLAYEVVEDVKVGNLIAVPAGSKGTAHVLAARPAGLLGRDAQLRLDFCTVTAGDGRLVPVTAPESTFAPGQSERSRAMAVGAGAAGLVLFGPAGAAGSLLVKGHTVVFEAGAEFTLATAATVKVDIFGL